MPHSNYFVVKAKDNHELGLALGLQFGDLLRQYLGKVSKSKDWGERVAAGLPYLTFAETAFPQYIQELKGYAEGANVPSEELWVLSLGDDLQKNTSLGRCTSVVTNQGKLIAHNEDWPGGSKEDICVLKKTVGNITIFELYYYWEALGGSAASINSCGYIQLVNSLNHSDSQIGIPRGIIARWLSETVNPDEDLEKLSGLRRSRGYSHTLVSRSGEIWNVECTAKEQVLGRPKIPFVHTNHYLTGLSRDDVGKRMCGTAERYNFATKNVRGRMSQEEMIKLMSDQSLGPDLSVLNERTIGRLIIDLEQRVAKVWLKREAEKDWVNYPLDFI